MTELRTYYGPTPRDPDPGKLWHYGCGGEVLTFKDGEPTCMKCSRSEALNELAVAIDIPMELLASSPIDSVAMYNAQAQEQAYRVVKAVAEENDVVIHRTCDGAHSASNMKYVGTLEVSICADPRCAHVSAKCTHQTPIPEDEDSTPRKYTKSACSWNEDGTVLTCDFCGVDGT